MSTRKEKIYKNNTKVYGAEKKYKKFSERLPSFLANFLKVNSPIVNIYIIAWQKTLRSEHGRRNKKSRDFFLFSSNILPTFLSFHIRYS